MSKKVKVCPIAEASVVVVAPSLPLKFNKSVVSSFDGFNNTTFSQNDLIAIQVKTSGLDNAFAVGWFQIEIEYDLLLTLNE